MASQTRLALLLLGLLVGGALGYVTRPAATEIRLGGASIELQDSGVAAAPSSGVTTGQGRRIMLFTVAGGIIGLLAGLAADRRR